MPNNINLITQYLKNTLDKVYMQASKTAILEAPNEMVREAGQAGVYMIPKISMQGLYNYSRSAGFTTGDVSLDWELVQLAYDRGSKFFVDRMDNEESAMIALANLAAEFLRTKVVPEVDALRFGRIAGKAGTLGAQASITTTAEARTAFRQAEEALRDNQVDGESIIMFCTPAYYGLFEEAVGQYRLIQGSNPDFRVANYNGIQIMQVPSSRFFSEISLLNDGDGGFSAEPSAVGLNFTMMDRNAVFQITKHGNGRLFSPDVVQDRDSWQYDYRIYHDLFTLDNKVGGIYVHRQPITAPDALTATIAAGSAQGTTKATASVASGNTLGYLLSETAPAIAAYTLKSRITGLVEPYTSGANISGDLVATGNHLYVMEFNSSGRVIKAKDTTLASNQIGA